MISNQMKVFSLIILTSMNVVNYLDRFIISALLPSIQAELHLNDTQLGLLHTAFTFSYILAAPILGFLGDRVVRKWLASGAVLFWSIATGLSGIAKSYHQLLGIRSMVGIGEAGYGPVAPTIISDYYSENVRSRMLSIYYVGTPLGSALGLMLGGVLGHYFGWRTAFLVAAIPGVFLAILALWIKEPPRGIQQIQNPSIPETFQFLRHTPSYIYNLLGTAAMTFATGGLAYWFPTFLFRMRGWHLTSATQFFGAITVVAGIAGTLFGGFIADLWQNKSRKSYFYVSALGMLIAAPCAVGAILIQNRAWVFPLVFLAEFFLFFNMGPLNAAIISVVHPKMRATAMALNILFIHLLGDAVSTWVIGKVSDMTQSLTAGVLIGPVAILLGGIILMSGANRLAEDQLKLDAELKKI